MREENIILTGQNKVSDSIPFRKGETRFLMETSLSVPHFFWLSLGGIKKEGVKIPFRKEDIEKEFPINGYEWVIIKANFLGNEDALRITLKFT